MISLLPERFHIIDAVLRRENLLQLNRGVEVGVRFSECSEFLLTLHKHLTLTLVDPYTAYTDVLGIQFTQEEQTKIKKDAANRLKKFNYRAKWIYKPSVEAALEIEDGSQDFIFIDCEHTELATSEALYSWYPKLRSGAVGFMHDISMAPVKKAVTDWCAKFGKELNVSDVNSDVGMFQI